MAPRRKCKRSAYDVSRMKQSASQFGEYEEAALNIRIEGTSEIRRVFPDYVESPIDCDLESLLLEAFDYDQIVTFAPTRHRDLSESQRRFLVRLKNVLTKNASDSNETRLELHTQVLVDNFFEQCKLDDGLELQMRPSALQMTISDTVFSAYGDREGRKGEKLVWVLQESKHKNDGRYKNGEIQLAASLIAACQEGYNDSACQIVPRVMHGVNVKGDKFWFLSAQFTVGYILSLFGGLPQEELNVWRYPRGSGLKLSNPGQRAEILRLMAELRRYALSIDISSVSAELQSAQ